VLIEGKGGKVGLKGRNKIRKMSENGICEGFGHF